VKEEVEGKTKVRGTRVFFIYIAGERANVGETGVESAESG